MEKRYEIFVSSTYEDLRDERQFIRDFITHQGDIPTGMEEFVGGRPSWDHIERAINSCDYYVLIVGGRYGSVNPASPEGYSFTECEFHLAQKLGKQCLFFVLSKKAVNNLPKEKREMSRAGKKSLEAFWKRLFTNNVVFWENTSDLEKKIAGKLSKWLEQNPLENGGWVRTKEYLKINKELIKAESRKYVFSYLFDRLNPYDNIHLTVQFVRDAEKLLEDRLDSISRLLRVLEKIINIYVRRLIEAQIRVYFAYSLNESDLSPDAAQTGGEPEYRLGISNSKEGSWQQGKVLKGFSNLHNVYQTCQILGHRDSTLASTRLGNLNVPVKDEGSVIAAPVFGGLGNAAVGVVGLSSPNKGEAQENYELVKELGVLFSALFYAYGRQLKPERGAKKTGMSVIYRLRNEIARHFESELGKPTETIE